MQFGGNSNIEYMYMNMTLDLIIFIRIWAYKCNYPSAPLLKVYADNLIIEKLTLT